MRAQPKASHFVDGAYLEDAAGPAFTSIYPATGEVIARLHAATPAVLEAALAAAAAAQPAWAALRPVERGRVLRRAADILRADNRALSELETLDTGKPLSETLVADAASGADCLEYFAGLAATVGGETVPLGADWGYTLREPHGVCLGIGAWNYPIQIACWKAAPALALGNALIFKPSELTPLSALKLAEALAEAGAPPGVFQVVQGAGEVGARLAGDARVAKVSLTGSVATGRRVAAQAAEAMRAVTMELGGKSPLIVFADASLEDAVGAAMLANFYSAGQVCSNGTRVFVQRPVYDAFRARLVARMSAIRAGDPLDEATTLGPLVSQAQRERVLGFLSRARAEGARITGGGVPDGPGFFVLPALVEGVSDTAEIAREEVFGPVLTLLPFDSEEEVVARANASAYGLAAGVFTADLARGHRVVGRLQAGTCWINAYNLTPVELPFGGVKLSGLGRENGRAAVEAWSRVKSVYVGMGPVAAPF